MYSSVQSGHTGDPANITHWLNNRGLANRKRNLLGYLGYFMGLCSSLFLVFIVDEYVKKLGVKSRPGAYIISVGSTVPLSILLGQVSKNTLSSWVDIKNPFDHTLLRPQNDLSCNAKIIKVVREAIFVSLSLTSSVPITYLSHVTLMKVTGSLVVSIVFDFFALVPRIIIVTWSLRGLFERIHKFFANKYQKKDMDALPLLGSSEMISDVTESLTQLLLIIGRLSNTEIAYYHKLVHSDGSDQLTWGKLAIILHLHSEYKELASPRHWLVTSLIELFSLLIGFAGSFVLVALGKDAYRAFSIPSKVNAPLAWIGCATFTTLLKVALTISFGRFYQTAQQTYRRIAKRKELSEIEAQSLGVGKLEWIRTNITPSLIMFFTGVAAVISPFPRIDVNEEEIFSVHNKHLFTLLNVVTGICYFSLDFWPLSNISQKFTKVTNEREQLSAPIQKLLNVVPRLEHTSLARLFAYIDQQKNIEIENEVSVNRLRAFT